MVHYPPVKSFVFSMIGTKLLVCAVGVSIDAIAVCFFTNAYNIFGTVPDLKECPLPKGVLLHIEMVSLCVCAHYVLNQNYLNIIMKNRNGL